MLPSFDRAALPYDSPYDFQRKSYRVSLSALDIDVDVDFKSEEFDTFAVLDNVDRRKVLSQITFEHRYIQFEYFNHAFSLCED